MAISQTFTVSHGREFGGSNPGAQWREDSGLRLNDGWFSVDAAFDSDRPVNEGGFYRTTVRSGTSWMQFLSGLALWNDGGVTGPSQDTVFDLYSPAADRWWRANISNHRDTGNDVTADIGLGSRTYSIYQADLVQASPTPQIAGRTYTIRSTFADLIEQADPHDLTITMTSASGAAIGDVGPPIVDTAFNMYVGDRQVQKIYVGDREVQDVYVGSVKV